MVTIALLAICAILTFIAAKTTFWIMKFFAGVSWWGIGVWWIQNPIGGDATKPIQTIMLLVALFVGIACFFWVFWDTRTQNGVERGRFYIPFLSKTDDQLEEERLRRHMPSRQERNSNYLERLEAAGRGERRRRY